MAIDTSVPRTRRALLAGGVGGAAALAASAIGRPLPAMAANGDYVRVGYQLLATTFTLIRNETNKEPVFRAESPSGTGFDGETISGIGVFGQGSSGIGVQGWSASGVGVRGDSDSVREAVLGFSHGDSTGVYGFSESDPVNPPPSPSKTGVYGYAAQDDTANGVYGRSTTGRGVWGQATSGRGVWGSASSGTGVRGYATSGTGGSFEATTGYALRAVGRVKLDKCAGVATIAAGTKSIVVTPGIDLVSTSAVVATLQGNPAGTTTVKSVSINTTANTFTIYLTANATANLKVAWHVFG